MKIKTNRLLVLLIVVVVAGYYYLATDRAYYFRSADGLLSFRIPDEIVKAKDCTKYQEFIHSLAAPTMLPNDKCPWPWDKVSAVAHFTMNGVKFEVPREYLMVGRNHPDGENDFISIQVQYPNMNAYHPKFGGKETIYDDISFSIEQSSRHIACAEMKNCNNIGQWFFGEKIKYIPQLEYGEGYDPSKPIKIEDMLDGTSLYNYNYKYKKGYEKEYYIKGNPLKPDYWVECYPPIIDINRIQTRPSCEGVFNWDTRYYIKYRFPREKLLSEQLQIKQKIEEKIKEFIVK